MSFRFFNKKNSENISIFYKFQFRKNSRNIKKIIVSQTIGCQISKLFDICFPAVREKDHANVFNDFIESSFGEL